MDKTGEKTIKAIKLQSAGTVYQDEAQALISQAIDKNVPVETMEKLLVMRRELRNEQAKEMYDRAMATFQSSCPTIKKTREVKNDGGRVLYSYAPIESIVEQVRKPLKTNGFSYSTSMELLENGVKVCVKVTHAGGHSEETCMTVPLGTKTQIMSNSQQVAAATTFAKRYAFCNAFGILTGDEDNDGQNILPAAQAPRAIAAPRTTVAPRLNYATQKKIFALLAESGKTKTELDTYIANRFKKDSITKLSEAQAEAVVKKLTGLGNKAETIGELQSPDNISGIQDVDGDAVASEVDAGLKKEGI